jgi:hypothetical protein
LRSSFVKNMDWNDVTEVFSIFGSKIKKGRILGGVRSYEKTYLGDAYKYRIGTHVEKIIEIGPYPNNNKYGHIVGKDEKNVSYCSQDCQKKDWKEHKLECKDYKLEDT